MKKAFLITSVIDVDNTNPLTYSKVRTTFSSADRFKHTIFTIASLDMMAGADTTIFLIDASEDYEQYKSTLGYQKNLVFVSVKEEFPDIFELVRTHPNKSFGESLMLVKFIEKYRSVLDGYDYYFKMSGRYFVDSNFDTSLLNEENLDKIFFKHPFKYEWNDSWNYQIVDRRAIQNDNKLYQYSSVLYGWGRMNMDRILDIYRVIATFTNHPNGSIYDVETLLYFFTRVYEPNIIETDWVVYGWDGAGGQFLRY